MVENKAIVKGLTEGELLDKINRDIAQWKNESDFNISEETVEQKKEVKPAQSGQAAPVKSEPIKAKKNNWSIPKTVKEAAEQVMEEDKPYAEEVNF